VTDEMWDLVRRHDQIRYGQQNMAKSLDDRALDDLMAHFCKRHVKPCGTQPGVKHDGGKAMAGLMVKDFARALSAVADITTFGANKYSPSGWRSVDCARERYSDALYRHLLSHELGEDFDKESDLLHLAHAAWNALALLQLRIEELLRQDG
jgi:hypothetical protein